MPDMSAGYEESEVKGHFIFLLTFNGKLRKGHFLSTFFLFFFIFSLQNVSQVILKCESFVVMAETSHLFTSMCKA